MLVATALFFASLRSLSCLKTKTERLLAQQATMARGVERSLTPLERVDVRGTFKVDPDRRRDGRISPSVGLVPWRRAAATPASRVGSRPISSQLVLVAETKDTPAASRETERNALLPHTWDRQPWSPRAVGGRQPSLTDLANVKDVVVIQPVFSSYRKVYVPTSPLTAT